MNDIPKLRADGQQEKEQFMTSEQYREFSQKMYEEIKPTLDKQREARIRSEDAAKRHLVS